MGKKHFKVKSSYFFSSINEFFFKSMHIIGNVNINAKPVFSSYYISKCENKVSMVSFQECRLCRSCVQISYGTAKMKLAMFACLYCCKFIKNPVILLPVVGHILGMSKTPM